ncbi:site-specific integrase [Mycolicibacterium fortuitum]|uniref:site-specific integrase n=1 Tax=Mycolicibacterium fortuitum TaxID=1766 RepID=UPI003A897D10
MEQQGVGIGWRLCYAEPRSRSSNEPELPQLDGFADLAAREEALGVRIGQPFLLGPGGIPDVDVLEFFRSTSFHALATGSQHSYALDLRLFLTFLSGQGVDWRAATESDLEDFEYWRRRDGRNTRRISGSKFSRELAAIGKFYGWQLRRGAVSSSPVAMRERELPSGQTTSVPALRPKSVRSVRMKWLTPRAYRRWRDVGLRGYLADGTRDVSWRGRNEGRNLAFSESLWSSGLRLREGGTLLLGELPQSEIETRYARGRLGRAVAKGRGRDYWIHGRALKLIDNYVITERAAAVRRAHREHRYDSLPDLKIVEKVDQSRRVHYTTRSGDQKVTPLDELTSTDRMTFFINGEEGLQPWSVWLTEAGMPLPYRTWEAIFSGASKRCAAFGVDLHCHPHMLRHSFALRMLMTLIYAHDRRMGITPEERREFRLIFGDPWVLVQTLLGHANLETTRQCYLEPVSGLQVELFLNDDDLEEASITDLMSRVAQVSAKVIDVEENS